jgi:V8-like Glu-specific endopeptidase
MRRAGALFGITIVACMAYAASRAHAETCPGALDLSASVSFMSRSTTAQSLRTLTPSSTERLLVDCGNFPLPNPNGPQNNLPGGSDTTKTPKIFVPGGAPISSSQLSPAPTPPSPPPGGQGPAGPLPYMPPLEDVRVAVSSGTAAPDIPTSLVVAIIYDNVDGRYICTGTIIDPTHILTAGHCGCGENYFVSLDTYVPLNDPAALDKLLAQRAIRISLPPLLLDQSVCKNGPKAGNDLALLVLPPDRIACKIAIGARAATLNGGPAPADCRSDAAQQNINAAAKTFGYPDDKFWNLMPQLPKGRKVTIAGYGYTERLTEGQLLQAEVPVASTACTESRLAPYCSPFTEMILAEPPGPNLRHDTCKGDSGGPVFLSDSGGYTLIAVTSRPAPGTPDNPDLQCGGGGIYTIIGRQTVKAWLQASGVSVARTLPAPSAVGLK